MGSIPQVIFASQGYWVHSFLPKPRGLSPLRSLRTLGGRPIYKLKVPLRYFIGCVNIFLASNQIIRNKSLTTKQKQIWRRQWRWKKLRVWGVRNEVDLVPLASEDDHKPAWLIHGFCTLSLWDHPPQTTQPQEIHKTWKVYYISHNRTSTSNCSKLFLFHFYSLWNDITRFSSKQFNMNAKRHGSKKFAL